MCEEHWIEAHCVIPDSRPPPHARGAHIRPEPVIEHLRITPACAGSTLCAACWTMTATDHPRMRGEHERDPLVPPNRGGSPPHARGTRGSGWAGVHDLGITPACAGNTFDVLPGRSPGLDHPRMRGEHMQVSPVRMCHHGSPPHARGTLDAVPAALAPLRITPACAGNTAARCPVVRHRADHPRMRGEHSRSPTADHRLRGSPPHARGTPPHPRLLVALRGITPACAGNTCGRAW